MPLLWILSKPQHRLIILMTLILIPIPILMSMSMSILIPVRRRITPRIIDERAGAVVDRGARARSTGRLVESLMA